MTPNEKAALICEHIAEHDKHGYSQPDREGTGWTESVDFGDGKPVTLHDQYDCSSMVVDSYEVQGINCGGASYTLNMYLLVDSGNFKSVPVEQRKRGDILNSTVKRHAAMYLGNGKLAEAWCSETGGIDGAVGDQTGEEIRIRDYYDDEWTACYRCIVKDGWVKESGTWYYYENGEMCKNKWAQWNGEWYYMGADGKALKNEWVKCGESSWLYFKHNGALAHDEPVWWNNGWCWADSNGNIYKNGKLVIENWHIKS